MFERFTKDAREVVVRAQEEARLLHRPFVGTEHLLLAMLEAGDGPSAEALRDRGADPADVRRRIAGLVDGDALDPAALATLGIDLDEVRRVTEATFGPGALDSPGRRPPRQGHIPFDKGAKKALELSLREAVRLGHKSLGTGHLLLGLTREGEGMAARVLVASGVDLTALRDDVTHLISTEAACPPPAGNLTTRARPPGHSRHPASGPPAYATTSPTSSPPRRPAPHPPET
ncbi:Clp protease N-terminal domain-containing protein [Actinoallomurus acaciae]|uniref:Clp protease N-terminal domain-containing protein n=1 Tax=Actinoallomurus acaciae TaxID=502577 RepID=A0ABV5YVC8_9ACTN